MQMVSDPDKIILESMAKAKGITVEEVKDNIKKNKKKSQKKRNNSPVEITISDKARSIDFSQIKGSIKRNTPKENVFEWGIKDVALYVKDKYYKKFKKDWMHRVIGSCPELRRIHDRILDIYGLCDFLVMRDYIDYIFSEKIEGIIDRAGGVFYVRNFRDDNYIIDFIRSYDYKDSFGREMWGNDDQEQLSEKPSMSNESIGEIFLLSEESFVTTYGIVVCIFWLIKYKKYANGDAARRVLDICQKLNNKGKFKLAKERTEQLSPYHESIRFPKMKEFLKNIDGRYKIEIEYKENPIIRSKFNFLEEQE